MVHVLRFQYTLSQETIDYLKQPTFDIWHWEPNEVMYESRGNRGLAGSSKMTQLWSLNYHNSDPIEE